MYDFVSISYMTGRNGGYVEQRKIIKAAFVKKIGKIKLPYYFMMSCDILIDLDY